MIIPGDGNGKAKSHKAPPVFEVSLEYEPTDDAEERLLMVYEILLELDDEGQNAEKSS